MQSTPPAVSGKKNPLMTVLIVALICVPLFFVAALAFTIVPPIFRAMTAPTYKTRTATAQAEIIKIEATTWSESEASGMRKTSGASHQVDGFKVSYKFTTADGKTIFQNDDRSRSKDLPVVCYDPAKPDNCGLYEA